MCQHVAERAVRQAGYRSRGPRTRIRSSAADGAAAWMGLRGRSQRRIRIRVRAPGARSPDSFPLANEFPQVVRAVAGFGGGLSNG